jgi:hypothetical protein
MPANTNPIFIGTRQSVAIELDNADGTTAITLWTAGAQGSLIEAIGATSTDTSAVELDLKIYDGAATFALGSVTIPVGAGTDGGTTPSGDILNQTDLPWLRDDLALALGPGGVLKVAAHAAITAAKVVHVVAFGGDY